VPWSELSRIRLNSDARSQYTAIHFTETLMLAGLKPSIGTVGDALDNGLAEATIGRYKTECVRAGSPFRTRPIRTLADLEDITSTWVCWYNASRLMRRLGRRPPTEAEAEYYARPTSATAPGARRDELARCIGTGVPVSPPSPGRITEPVFRDAGTSLRPGRGDSVSACHLRFPYRALFCPDGPSRSGLDASRAASASGCCAHPPRLTADELSDELSAAYVQGSA
jgi:hypothetical protein